MSRGAMCAANVIPINGSTWSASTFSIACRPDRLTGSDAVILAEVVVHGSILITDGKIVASLQALVVGNFGHIPRSEAAGIAVVAASNLAAGAI